MPAVSVGVLGLSMGGAATLLAAAEEPALQAVVVDSAFSHVRDMIAPGNGAHYALLQVDGAGVHPGHGGDVRHPVRHRRERGGAGESGRNSSLPHPGGPLRSRQPRIPVEQGVRIHASAQKGSEFWVVPGSDHVDAFLDAPDEYVERVDAYFNDRLMGAAPGN